MCRWCPVRERRRVHFTHHVIGWSRHCTNSAARRGGSGARRDRTHQEMCRDSTKPQLILWACTEQRDRGRSLTTPTYHTPLTLYTLGGLLHTQSHPTLAHCGSHAHTPPHLHVPHTLSHLHLQRRCVCVCVVSLFNAHPPRRPPPGYQTWGGASCPLVLWTRPTGQNCYSQSNLI